MHLQRINSNNGCILYDADFFEDPGDVSFDSTVWAQRDSISGFAEGRGTTFFVNYHGRELALRHYHRGGLIARWSPDRYLWSGLDRTRAWRELHLLRRMHELDLPVPRPVAAQVVRAGLFYTADIMTRRIPNARTVAQLLGSHSLDNQQWLAIGRLIRRFHEQGVYHADLNANNIMLDEAGQLYLIDFDRGAFKTKRSAWQQRNLQRLLRSLHKLKGKQSPFYFSESDWQALLDGYSRQG